MKISSFYEKDEDLDKVYWLSNHNDHTMLRINNKWVKIKCFGLPFALTFNT
jgi:hypothetical protein